MDTVRSYAPVWYFRLGQAFVTIIVLSITGSSASSWHSSGCSTPTRLSYNISCAALTLPLVLYFIFSSGPVAKLHKLPWSRWVQLGFDALFFLLWLATASASNYTCSGLCSSCSNIGRESDTGYYYVWVGSLYCTCDLPSSDDKRSLYPRAGGYRSGSGDEDSGVTKLGIKASKLGAKKGFDALMVVLFFLTLALTAYRIYKRRQEDRSAPAAHSSNDKQMNHPEGGMGIGNP